MIDSAATELGATSDCGGALLQSQVERLRAFISAHPRLFVLTGAGISSGSGIPTYRDHHAQWQRNAPITHQAFTTSADARKRYWARSLAGWPLMSRAEPNAAHAALATLQRMGRISTLVTQNVDGLHQRAGSAGVIELHGNVGDVVCLDCGSRTPRADMQRMLIVRNPHFDAMSSSAMRPDGDAEIEAATDRFDVPACESCGGMLKPDVVFFGANVPRERVERTFDALDAADAMLVVGSSLMVYSGYRFCERAHERGKPIASVNIGRTRADALYALKVEADCSTVIPQLVA